MFCYYIFPGCPNLVCVSNCCALHGVTVSDLAPSERLMFLFFFFECSYGSLFFCINVVQHRSRTNYFAQAIDPCYSIFLF